MIRKIELINILTEERENFKEIKMNRKLRFSHPKTAHYGKVLYLCNLEQITDLSNIGLLKNDKSRTEREGYNPSSEFF